MLFRRVFGAAADGLVVVKFGKGRPEVAMAGGADFEAKIDVVESDGEIFFVESADLIEDFFLKDETGGGHGTVILDEARAVENALGIAGEVAERVT